MYVFVAMYIFCNFLIQNNSTSEVEIGYFVIDQNDKERLCLNNERCIECEAALLISSYILG